MVSVLVLGSGRPWGAERAASEVRAVEVGQLVECGVDVLVDPVGLDVLGALDEEQLLVVGAGGFRKASSLM